MKVDVRELVQGERDLWRYRLSSAVSYKVL